MMNNKIVFVYIFCGVHKTVKAEYASEEYKRIMKSLTDEPEKYELVKIEKEYKNKGWVICCIQKKKLKT